GAPPPPPQRGSPRGRRCARGASRPTAALARRSFRNRGSSRRLPCVLSLINPNPQRSAASLDLVDREQGRAVFIGARLLTDRLASEDGRAAALGSRGMTRRIESRLPETLAHLQSERGKIARVLRDDGD